MRFRRRLGRGSIRRTNLGDRGAEAEAKSLPGRSHGDAVGGARTSDLCPARDPTPEPGAGSARLRGSRRQCWSHGGNRAGADHGRPPLPCSLSQIAGWDAGLDPSASSLSPRCPISPFSLSTTTDLCFLMSFPSCQVAAPLAGSPGGDFPPGLPRVSIGPRKCSDHPAFVCLFCRILYRSGPLCRPPLGPGNRR